MNTDHETLQEEVSQELAYAVNLMAHPAAGFMAGNALLYAMASQAFGAWNGVVSNVFGQSQKMFTRIAETASTSHVDAKSVYVERTSLQRPVTMRHNKRVQTLTATVKPVVIDMPDKVDDLKLISGVGPKLETALNQLGIWTYRQVELLSEHDIAHLDEKLSIAERIHSDNWLEQAKALADVK